MKKFILIALMAVLALGANAQTWWKAPASYNITNTVGVTKNVAFPLDQPSTQTLAIHLDSVSGNHTNVAVSLYGVKTVQFGDSTIIGSVVNWKGTLVSGGADTTIYIANASANRYIGFKIVIKGTGTGVTRAYWTELKAFKE